MVEKIIVNPLNVRGKGNIISPKSIVDFETYNCSLTFQEDMYTMKVGGYSVSLTLSSNSVFYEETVTLTATVTDLETGTPVTGETVEFLAGETSLGTDTTDSDGVATLTESTLLPDTYTVYARYGDNTGSASLTVKKHNIYSISNTQSPTYYDSSYIVFEGQILASDYDVTTTVPVPNMSIDVYMSAGSLGHDTKLGTVTSDSNGEFDTGTLIPYNSSTINKQYYFRFEGNTIYAPANSPTKTAVLSKYTTFTLTNGENSTWYIEDGEDSFGVGLGIVSDDPAISGKSLKVYLDNTLIETVTSIQGFAEVDYTYSGTGTYAWKVEFEGDSNYEASSKTWNTVVSNFTDNIVLSASSSSILVGGSSTLSATVTDINGGVMRGQSVSFYDGNTLLGSATTDSSGVASVVFSGSVVGVHSISARSYGVTSNTVNITVSDAPSYDGITLTSDKSVLSYHDSDSAVLSAQLMDGTSTASVSGVTVEFFKGSTSLGTAQTDSNGVATKTYNSTGEGDISLTASDGTLVSEICSIEDCFFYGLNTNAFTIPSNTTFSSNGDYITATTSASEEKIVYLNHTLTDSDNWIFANEVAYKGSSEQVLSIIWNDNSFYGGQGYGENYVYSYMGSQTKKTHTVQIGDKFTVKRENGVTSVYINDELIESKTISHKASFRVGYFINRGRTQYYKNIKFKPL